MGGTDQPLLTLYCDNNNNRLDSYSVGQKNLTCKTCEHAVPKHIPAPRNHGNYHLLESKSTNRQDKRNVERNCLIYNFMIAFSRRIVTTNKRGDSLRTTDKGQVDMNRETERGERFPGKRLGKPEKAGREKEKCLEKKEGEPHAAS